MKKSLLFAIIFLLFAGVSQAQITSVGLIGSAAPFGWDADTNMVQDMDSAHIWTLEIALIDGAVKFRADDDWAVNWGSNTFPIGVGTQDGPDIPVYAGDYKITFNSNTGFYYLEIASPIGILGDATPFGWDSDVNLVPDTSAAQDTDVFFVNLDLLAGKAKFRADDDWAVNWGGADFPSGVGTQDGPDIEIPRSGNYDITFNKGTGEYNFKENVAFTAVGIIGDATTGGWDTPTEMIQDAGDGDLWRLSTSLSAGGLQFTGNNGEVVWGAADFPSGTATVGGDTIPIPDGNWQIEFNTKTGQFLFLEIRIFETIGVIGDATPGGWVDDTDMERSATDSSQWSLRVILTDGFAKFRADNDWVVNWGAGDFPSGVGTQDGADIPVTAGEYIIDFNSISGAYNFREIIVYDTLGIVGNASPNESWDVDVYLDKSAEDENMWTLQSIALFNFDQGGQEDGGIKFRANSDWTVNWGAADWPTGLGTQDGDNIITVAGTYGVTFNDATGEYAFGDPLTSTTELLKPSDIKAFPNPASNILNVDFAEVQVSGKLNMRVYDMRGQLLLTELQNAAQIVHLDITKLPIGNYTLQVTAKNMMVGKRFAVIRK